MDTKAKDMLTKLVAIFVILLINASDYLFVGTNVISYAVGIVKASSYNVDFSAYFLEDDLVKVKEAEKAIDAENVKLYLEVSVKNEGYFNGNIILENSNFRFKKNQEIDKVEKITENNIKLSQINAGESITLPLEIEAIKQNNISIQEFNKTTDLALEGKYIDSKLAEKNDYTYINEKEAVKINWKSSDLAESELEASVLTNNEYNIQEEKTNLVQILVKSKLKNNSYPAKNTQIVLNIPQKVEKVKVHTRKTEATNNDLEFSEQNYVIDDKKNLLTINIANNDEKITWNQNAEDIFVISYICKGDVNIQNEEINISSKITTYDEKIINSLKTVKVEEKIDGIITKTLENEEESIPKGKIYTEEEREYSTNNTINLDYVDAINKVIIKAEESKYMVDEIEETANIVYSSSEINKNEFMKIFGENGFIIVKNADGAVIENITKNTEANEEGYIIIDYSLDKNISLETSKPVKEGILKIKNNKIILNSNRTREEYDRLSKIKEKILINEKEEKSFINLTNTETNAILSLDKTEISTLKDKEQIIIDATLDSIDETKNLYKNPEISFILPKELEILDAGTNILYKNELNEEYSNIEKNENGENVIKIKFSGEQKKYDVAGGTKIRIKLNVKVDKLVPTKTVPIIMNYYNEYTNETKQKQVDLKLKSKDGLMLYSQILNLNRKEEKAVTTEEEQIVGKIEANDEEKKLTLNTALINNFDKTLTNVEIIGNIPTNSSEKEFRSKLTKIKTNRDDIKVYYSTKLEAKAEENVWTENTENAVSYKLVIPTMQPEEIVTTNIYTIVEADILEGKEGKFFTLANCNNEEIKQTVSTTILLQAEKMSEPKNIEIVNQVAENEGEIPTRENVTPEIQVQDVTPQGLRVDITATSGEKTLEDNANIYEGETIKYKVTITNNSQNDYRNVKIKAVQKNGYVWDVIEKEMEHPSYEEKVKRHFYECTDKNEIVLADSNILVVGKTYTYEYEATTYTLNDSKIDGTNTYGTIYITSDDNALNENIRTIQNNLKRAEIKATITATQEQELEWTSQNTIATTLKIENLTSEKQENVKVQVTTSKNLNFGEKDKSLGYYLLFNEINDRVVLGEKEKNANGQTIITFSITSLEPNEVVSIDMYPSTSKIDEEEDSIELNAKIQTESNTIYNSNSMTRTIKKWENDIEVSQELLKNKVKVNTEKDVVKNEEDVELIAKIENKEEHNVSVFISYNTSKALEIEKVTYSTKDGEKNVDVKSNYIEISNAIIPAKDTMYITIKAKINVDKETEKNVKNTIDIQELTTLHNYSSSLNFNIDKNTSNAPIKDGIDDIPESNGNNNNGNNGGNESDEGDYTDDEQNGESSNQNGEEGSNSKYEVSGTVWLDENKNGKKDASESKIKDVKVGIINLNSKELEQQMTTNSNGRYLFNISQGKYMIVFFYDSDKYDITSYHEKGIFDTENSDAVQKTIIVDGKQQIVAATDEMKITNKQTNVDLGLINKGKFKLNIQKYVSKITVKNKEGTKTKEYSDKTVLAKTEIRSKYMEGSEVEIEYQIVVSNEGDIEGYAKSIVDNKSKELHFDSKQNSGWSLKGEYLYNTSFANTPIKPGESKVVTLKLTKTMTNSNTGLVNNTAQIEASSNSNGIKNESENKGSADVIISVSTGKIISYITVALSVFIGIAVIIYFIGKKKIKT